MSQKNAVFVLLFGLLLSAYTKGQGKEVDYLFYVNPQKGTYAKIDRATARVVEHGDFTKKYLVIPQRLCKDANREAVSRLITKLRVEFLGKGYEEIICTEPVKAEDENKIYVEIAPESLPMDPLDFDCRGKCSRLQVPGMALKAGRMCRGECVLGDRPRFVAFHKKSEKLYFAVMTDFGGTGNPPSYTLFVQNSVTGELSSLGFADDGYEVSPGRDFVALRHWITEPRCGRTVATLEVVATETGKKLEPIWATPNLCTSVKSSRWLSDSQLLVEQEIFSIEERDHKQPNETATFEKVFDVREKKLIREKKIK